MTTFFKKHILTIIGILAGGVGGYCYWLKIGCATGTCPITSSPMMSTLYGMLLGGLIFSMFRRENKNKK